MASASLDRLLNAPRFPSVANALAVSRTDAERLEGRVGGARRASSGAAKAGLSRVLQQRAALLRHARSGPAGGEALSFDARQRAVVKVHYFQHSGGGGAALKAHAHYVARDAAGREEPNTTALEQAPDGEVAGRAHADYLSRGESERFPFYDAWSDGVDGAARAADWAARDKRHFRLILSAERGELIADLPAYTREVMARAEAQLATRLDWVAVDHHDTDNPHTHLILRGRRTNGQDLILPKDFVRHGLRNIARDVATDWLGARTPADERLALQNEVIRHAPTRLDRLIADQLPEGGQTRVARLQAPNGDPAVTQALKARAKELTRLGLASEAPRNVLAFAPDWQERLRAMELHLNLRKRLMLERSLQRQRELDPLAKQLSRGLIGR